MIVKFFHEGQLVSGDDGGLRADQIRFTTKFENGAEYVVARLELVIAGQKHKWGAKRFNTKEARATLISVMRNSVAFERYRAANQTR